MRSGHRLLIQDTMMWKNLSLEKTALPHRFHISLFLKLSQPAHMMTFVLVLYLGFQLFPKEPRLPWEPSPLSSFLYVSAFSIHYGTQIWMTLISGIVLFFSLPRKVFGLVQKHLFPKYFLLNSVLGFVTFFIFVLHHPTLDFDLAVQRWALAVCFLCDLLAMLYIVPDMLVTMEIRSTMENEARTRQEIGRHDEGHLRDCPHYKRLHKRFRTFHGACAVTNIIAMCCNSVHMYHLAWRLCSIIT